MFSAVAPTKPIKVVNKSQNPGRSLFIAFVELGTNWVSSVTIGDNAGFVDSSLISSAVCSSVNTFLQKMNSAINIVH